MKNHFQISQTRDMRESKKTLTSLSNIEKKNGPTPLLQMFVTLSF